MQRLLPYYERELATLRDLSREFSEQYPALAGQLGMANGHCDDPSIGHLVQSIALLNARTAMRLDDGHAEFTESLLQVNAPQCLQPFPSSAIARFDMAGSKEKGGAARIGRGAILNSAECQGVVCRFRTVFDVAPLPLAVTDAAFHPLIQMPLPLQRPEGVTASIRIELASQAPSLGLAELARLPGGTSLRLYLDGDPAICAALRDTVFLRARHAYVQANGEAAWRPLARVPLREAGFEPEDAMLPQRSNMHPAWRLLTEYFVCPEKFNFIEIDLAAIAAELPSACRRVALHLALSGIRSDAEIVRQLRPLNATHLLTGCTPVINLFPQAAIPIQVDHATPDYALLASPDHAHAYDIHSIATVRMLKQTVQQTSPQASQKTSQKTSPQASSQTSSQAARQSVRNDALIDFHPYYSLRHGEAGGKRGRYWVLRRDDVMAHTQPGYEYRIALVDLEMNPLALEAATVSVALNCSNRDLPHGLPWALPEGDLRRDNAADSYPIRLLRRPTLPCRYPATAQWRLIAQLSLNLRALLDGGLPALKEMLLLHDMRLSPVTQRMIDGIQCWSHRRARQWLAGNKGGRVGGGEEGSFCFGVEIRVSLDQQAFAGASMHAFIRVLDCFLGQHAPLNSFTRLVALDHASGMELLRCQPRCGDIAIA